MSNGRAVKGGQTGTNGEWYEGGKFLPSTKQPKHHGGKVTRGPRRAMIEPGVWAEAPEGKGAIWESISALIDGAARWANPQSPLLPIPNAAAIECHGGAAVLDRIAAYNRGERWRDL